MHGSTLMLMLGWACDRALTVSPMTNESYWAWSPEKFLMQMRCISPEMDRGDLEIPGMFDDCDPREAEGFRRAFREFLLDESMTFQEKARHYMELDWPSGKYFDFLKEIWGIIAPDQPWPLEGRPRPEDEPPPKSYQFKPQ